MSRQCERPGCTEPARVSYGFDPVRQLAWFDALGATGSGVLCQRHADAMVMPRGWWLDDRRQATPQLFTPPPASDPTPTGGIARPGRRRRSAVEAPSLLDAESASGGMPGSGAPTVAEARRPGDRPEGDPVRRDPDDTPAAWSPVDLPRGDLGGLLDVRSPLLSRAFGRTSPETPRR